MTSPSSRARVRFTYLYRDAGNYKQHGSLVLANADQLPLELAAKRVRAACDGGESFNAAQVGLPELFFEDGITGDDHSWHEFVSLDATSAEPTDPRSLRELVETFERQRQRGWRIDGERLMGE